MVGLLMAMAAAPAVMQVVAITTVFGNVNVEKSLRNVIAMFYILWQEMGWRKSKGKDFGYGVFESSRPMVTLGSGHALGEPVVLVTDGRPCTYPAAVVTQWILCSERSYANFNLQTDKMAYGTFMQR